MQYYESEKNMEKKEETENCQPIRERQVVTVHTAGQKWFEK